MAGKRPGRNTEFRMALEYNQESMSEWARRNNLTPGHVSLVATGERKSERLEGLIDKYICEFRKNYGSARKTAA